MQQTVRSVTLAYSQLPKAHRFLLGALTVITLAIVAWRPHQHTTQKDREVPLVSSATPHETAPLDSEPLDQPMVEALPQDELDQKIGTGMEEYIISSGDTLSSILTQYGIDMSEISLLSKRNKALRNLKIGQQLSWTVNEQGELQTLTWNVSRREVRVYQRQGDDFVEQKQIKEGEWKESVVTGVVNGSFVNSARDAGLSNSEIQAVSRALQWQLDFRKLQKGDRFIALFSREFLDGKSEQSELVGVRLNSNGKDYYAIQADDGKFYDLQGSGLARGFMRLPTLKKFRVTSNFNPHRLNPVTRVVAAHNGVDFGMPVGTPVLAVGDGEVIVAKRDGAAGIHVAIRHGRQYTTRYMHLNKLLVKPGQKVKRGDRIALSGNTGRSTGPHLHFEFLINQRPVNP
ncbi:MAG: murein DD-endopeptidase MepM, partial [Enterobacteriaceae bacterium]